MENQLVVFATLLFVFGVLCETMFRRNTIPDTPAHEAGQRLRTYASKALYVMWAFFVVFAMTKVEQPGTLTYAALILVMSLGIATNIKPMLGVHALLSMLKRYGATLRVEKATVEVNRETGEETEIAREDISAVVFVQARRDRVYLTLANASWAIGLVFVVIAAL